MSINKSYDEFMQVCNFYLSECKKDEENIQKAMEIAKNIQDVSFYGIFPDVKKTNSFENVIFHSMDLDKPFDEIKFQLDLNSDWSMYTVYAYGVKYINEVEIRSPSSVKIGMLNLEKKQFILNDCWRINTEYILGRESIEKIQQYINTFN